MSSSPNIRICPCRLLYHWRVGVADRIILRPALTPVHLVVRHGEALDFGPWILGASGLDVRRCRGWHCTDAGGRVEVTATSTDGSDGLAGSERIQGWAGDGRPAGEGNMRHVNPVNPSSTPHALLEPPGSLANCGKTFPPQVIEISDIYSGGNHTLNCLSPEQWNHIMTTGWQLLLHLCCPN